MVISRKLLLCLLVVSTKASAVTIVMQDALYASYGELDRMRTDIADRGFLYLCFLLVLLVLF